MDKKDSRAIGVFPSVWPWLAAFALLPVAVSGIVAYFLAFGICPLSPFFCLGG